MPDDLVGDALERGVELLRQGDFFAAHEELEEAWRAAVSDERDFFQGLVHVAVAWHHACTTGRRVACARQLEKATRRLSRYAPDHRGVDVALLLEQLGAARRAPFPALPSLLLPPPRKRG